MAISTEELEKYYRRHLENKKYSRLLAVPGNVAQASEFTDIQDILGNQIKSVGDAVMSEGNIVKGCEIVIDKVNKRVTITPGKVYLDGFVRDVEETTVPISINGTANICAWVEEDIVTSDIDTDLYDPSILKAYQQEGCDAIHYVVRIGATEFNSLGTEVATDDITNAAVGKPILYTLVDGALPTTQVANNQYEPIVEIMARRTYDESGNYRIRGLRIVDRKANDANNIFLTLTSGKAYIRGYEVEIPFDTKFSVRKATDTDDAFNVSKRNAKEYQLLTTPIAEIKEAKFFFTKSITFEGGINRNETKSLGTDGEGDTIDSVESVDAITVGGRDVTSQLTKDVDYKIEANGITLLTNAVIGWGNTFAITLTYSKRITKYTVTSDGLFKYTGNLAVATSRDASISYTYYLSRRDLVAIDSKGKIWVTEGQPNVQSLCSVPKVDDPNTLPLGVITVVAGSITPAILDQSVDVTDMLTLQKMLRRLQELEYNSAIGDLDREAIESEDATELIGVYTDGFVGWTKMDKGRADIDCAINSEEQFLSVSYDLGEQGLKPKTQPNYCGVFSLPFTEVLTNFQTLASESQKINPYQAFDPLVPIKLRCYRYSQDVRYYNGAVTYNQTTVDLLPWKNQLSCTDIQKNDFTVREGTKTVSQTMVINDRTNWYSSGGKSTIMNYFNVTNINKLSVSGSAVSSGTFGSQTWSQDYDVSTTVRENAVVQAHMKSKTIYVYATGFVAYCDKIYATFGGDMVSLSKATDPTGQYSSGCTQGTALSGGIKTIRADANGTILASFEIPANTPCGKYDIRIHVTANTQQGVLAKEGLAVYDGQYATQRTTTTITPIHKTLGVTIRNTDPLAQSFVFDEEKFLTGIDLYFSVCNDKNSVLVQIRNMVNGYPGTEVLGEQILTTNNIKVSSNGTVATKVTFDNPIRLNANTQYCIVVLTDSATTSLWTATLGQRKWGYNDTNDPNKQQFITAQPYVAGVLFTSSNNLTWTAHQNSDLKFGVYTARFNTSPVVIEYEATGNANSLITNFALEVDYVLPSGCSIIWEYHTDAMASTNKYVPLEPFEEIVLDKGVHNITVRATMKSNNPLVSPLISNENAWLTFICNHSKATYYSRGATLGDFNHLKIQVDLSISTAHTHKVYYSLDGGTFVELNRADATMEALGNGYNRYLWDMQKNGRQVAVKIEMSTTDVTNIPKAQKLIIIGSDL